ncbi:putative gag-pol poly protein [Colletotrichum tabaci]|uniref:Gag-pol poly protein n=1 Tax=Colletotrichum tabaci TaxID=1209068 RepID=A0AAV9STH1_9PEZI
MSDNHNDLLQAQAGSIFSTPGPPPVRTTPPSPILGGHTFSNIQQRALEADASDDDDPLVASVPTPTAGSAAHLRHDIPGGSGHNMPAPEARPGPAPTHQPRSEGATEGLMTRNDFADLIRAMTSMREAPANPRMVLWNDPTAPRFVGDNISNFLRDFEAIGRISGINDNTLRGTVHLYCDDTHRYAVESYVQGRTWTQAKAELKRVYEAADVDQLYDPNEAIRGLALRPQIAENDPNALVGFINEIRGLLAKAALKTLPVVSNGELIHIAFRRLPEKAINAVAKHLRCTVVDLQTTSWDRIEQALLKWANDKMVYRQLSGQTVSISASNSQARSVAAAASRPKAAKQVLKRVVADTTVPASDGLNDITTGVGGLSINQTQLGHLDPTVQILLQQNNDIMGLLRAQLRQPSSANFAEVNEITTQQSYPGYGNTRVGYQARGGYRGQSNRGSYGGGGYGNNNGYNPRAHQEARQLDIGPNECGSCGDEGHRYVHCHVYQQDRSAGLYYISFPSVCLGRYPKGMPLELGIINNYRQQARPPWAVRKIVMHWILDHPYDDLIHLAFEIARRDFRDDPDFHTPFNKAQTRIAQLLQAREAPPAPTFEEASFLDVDTVIIESGNCNSVSHLHPEEAFLVEKRKVNNNRSSPYGTRQAKNASFSDPISTHIPRSPTPPGPRVTELMDEDTIIAQPVSQEPNKERLPSSQKEPAKPKTNRADSLYSLQGWEGNLKEAVASMVSKKASSNIPVPVDILRFICDDFAEAEYHEALRVKAAYEAKKDVYLEAPDKLKTLVTKYPDAYKGIAEKIREYNSKGLSTTPRAAVHTPTRSQTRSSAQFVEESFSVTDSPSTIGTPRFVMSHLYLDVSIGGSRGGVTETISSILDTGSTINVIDEQYVISNGLQHLVTPTTLGLKGFTNPNMPQVNLKGALIADIWIGDYRICDVGFFVVPTGHSSKRILLGAPFIVATRMELEYAKDWVRGSFYTDNAKIHVPLSFFSDDSGGDIRVLMPQWDHPGWAAGLDIPGVTDQLEDDEEIVTSFSVEEFEEILDISVRQAAAPLVEDICQIVLAMGKHNPDCPGCGPDCVSRRARTTKRTRRRPQPKRPPKHRRTHERGLAEINHIDHVIDSVRPPPAEAFTLYKSKDKKVHPIDDAPSDGTIPEGDPEWKLKAWGRVKDRIKTGPNVPFSDLITPKFSTLEKGSRLTKERLDEVLKTVPHLLEREKKLLTEVLKAREGALAWEFPHCGSLHPSVAPPQTIKTVPHKAWQAKSIPIPRALEDDVITILKDRIRKGILEQSHAAYRNPFFLVRKKDGKMRLINSATKMNGVTLRDAALPPGADEFSEDFAMCQLLSLLDFFSGYDQVPLDPKSRDITTFSTPIGLLRMCTLPQGATNSVAQFMRVMTRILYDLIPHCCKAFLDDIAIKGPTSRYDDEELEDYPGIRRYVYEHIKNLDNVLVNVELAECTIAVVKSQWCQESVGLVGYVCGTNGRKPDDAKIIKIKEWQICESVGDIRSFLGIASFYRIWVKNFSTIAKPLTEMLKKDVAFRWGSDQQTAMSILQTHLCSAPVLITISYKPGSGNIYLATDASGLGWGAVLGQMINGKRAVSRFESGSWTGPELSYDAGKKELRGVLKALKRVRNYLYGVHFILETDAKTLVAQLNGAASDLPGALIIRWISWIRMFDFEVKHISGAMNSAADGLSRKPSGPSDLQDAEAEGEIDDWIDSQIFFTDVESNDFFDIAQTHGDDERMVEVLVTHGNLPDEEIDKLLTIPGSLLDDSQVWSRKSKQIAYHLTTMRRPPGIRPSRYGKFKTEAQEYMLHERLLFTRPTVRRNTPRRVVDCPGMRKRLVVKAHQEGGHRRREGTYARLADRFFWPGMYNEIATIVQTCKACQDRDRRFIGDPHSFSLTASLPFARISLDVQFIGKWKLIEARDLLTGWPEARFSKKVDSKTIATFIWEEIVTRHGLAGTIIVDGGPENKGHVIAFNNKYGMRRMVTSAYNPQANGTIETGHRPIAKALSVWTNEGERDPRPFLHTALFADRTSVRSATGYSPFYLNHGYDPVTPIETLTRTWRILDWDSVRTPEQELAMRIRAFAQLDEDRENAVIALTEKRRAAAEGFNYRNANRTRSDRLDIGDMVLVFDVKQSIDKSADMKLKKRWKGPFRIHSRAPDTSSYQLETLGGEPIKGSTYGGGRLKKFIQAPDGLWEPDDVEILRSELQQDLDILYPRPTFESRSGLQEVEDDNDEEIEELMLPQATNGDTTSRAYTRSMAHLDAIEKALEKVRKTFNFEVALPQMDPAKRDEYVSVPDE